MFTVIVPTHERPELLRRTLRSLIAQTYRRFTVVIVSDSAKYLPPYEELLELHGRYVYIIRSGVAGPAESRNMGLAVAGSEYILFLDDDDTFEPGHLQALADRISHGSPELIFCDFKVRHEDRAKSPPAPLSMETVSIADITKESVFVRNRIPNSCLAYRRDVIADAKFNLDLVIYEDWAFLLECLMKWNLTHLPVDSVVIHKSQATSPENLRRGNSRDDLIVETMLHLYKKYPGPDKKTRLARQSLMASAGVSVGIESC